MTVWGLLPVALPLALVTALGLGALAFRRAAAPVGERLLAGSALLVAVVAVGVRVLGAAGALSTPVMFASTVVVTATVLIAVHIQGLHLPWPRRWPVSAASAPVLVVAACGLAVVVAAGYLLPVWQWDALGYHLPYVNFALQRGDLADVPPDVPYLSTYPHVIEYAFIAWRAMLPDDGVVELAQLPFGLLGALAIAVIARRQGARSDAAVAAGAVWLTLPAAFLQLPTNYVDVASAALLLTAIAFVLGPADRTRILLAALAIGMFLGSKPSAPIAAAILFVAVYVVAARARRLRLLPVAGAVALLAGGESYVTNLARHANPLWPIRIDIGPLHLPGRHSISELLAAGAAAPRTHGNLAERVIGSWFAVAPEVPAFDMRIGGLGVLFLAALPVAAIRVVRTRSALLVLVVAATLATPDPAIARFVLAFAGLTLALAIPAVEHLGGRRRLRALVFGAVALGAAHNLYVGYPGLTGEGPPLHDYLAMTDGQRRRAVGADGAPKAFLDAMARVKPGEVTLFDRTADLPYLAWPPDLSSSAERIPDDVTAAEAYRMVRADDVGLLIVGDDTVAGAVARDSPDLFMKLFDCRSSTCAVYLRS